MLRITPHETEKIATLKLEGSLSGPWVDELRRCWTNLAEGPRTVELDLRGVSFLDPDGATLLLRMERQGTRLLGSSAFLQHLLYRETPQRNTPPRKSSKREN